MVSLEGGESMKKYRYTVAFCSDLDDTKKAIIVQKLRDTLKTYLQNGTITATSDAIHVDAVDIGETYSIVE